MEGENVTIQMAEHRFLENRSVIQEEGFNLYHLHHIFILGSEYGETADVGAYVP